MLQFTLYTMDSLLLCTVMAKTTTKLNISNILRSALYIQYIFL